MLKILTSMFKKGDKDDTLWDATTVIEDENDDAKKPSAKTPESAQPVREAKQVDAPAAKSPVDAQASSNAPAKSAPEPHSEIAVRAPEKTVDVAPSVAKIAREEARDGLSGGKQQKAGNRGVFGEDASKATESASGLKGNRGIFGDEPAEEATAPSGLKGNRGVFGDESQPEKPEMTLQKAAAEAAKAIDLEQSPAAKLFDGVKDKSEISKKLGALGAQGPKSKLKKPADSGKKSPEAETRPGKKSLDSSPATSAVSPASATMPQELEAEPIEQYETGAVCKIILKSDWEDLSVGWNDSAMPKDDPQEAMAGQERTSEASNSPQNGVDGQALDASTESEQVGFEAGGAAWRVLGIKESSNHLAIAKSCLLMLCAKGFTMDRLSEDLLDVQTEPASSPRESGDSLLSKKWFRMLIAKGVSIEEFAEAMVQIEVEIEEEKLRKIREDNELE